MIKIAYGESNFQRLIKEKCFYYDRTMFIEKLENNTSSYIYYLRPRRFGKSLFIMMLHYYYGLEHKSKFGEIFDNLYIGKKPTELANGYLVLSFEFSGIMNDTPQHTFEGFLSNVKSGVSRFLSRYAQYFPEKVRL